ncbi:hypothetical protein [Acetonema longum]|uniref:Uncharacterized protein n=1 Tax=Acetonema longum DSM 6540 TaxID=1009370 RepID=F7NKG2_9FIRM|nr:hypothetical protein [Acetonema longum]EGO63603.1 hypothetical protein ALO_12876 [Acetonema longum DSM 6540]
MEIKYCVGTEGFDLIITPLKWVWGMGMYLVNEKHEKEFVQYMYRTVCKRYKGTRFNRIVPERGRGKEEIKCINGRVYQVADMQHTIQWYFDNGFFYIDPHYEEEFIRNKGKVDFKNAMRIEA